MSQVARLAPLEWHLHPLWSCYVKTFEDFYPLLSSTIAGIATEYGRKGSWYGAGKDDFSQQMIAWLLDHEKSIAARFRDSTENATRYVARCLRNECKDHMLSLRGQTSNSTPEAQYDYGREELKVLLQLMFLPPDAECTTYSIIESVRDVGLAFARLADEDQGVLTAFHRDQYTNKLLAEVQGITEANMSYRHNAAVLRLQRLLGSTQTEARDPWVGRRAMSNSSARSRTSANYEE